MSYYKVDNCKITKGVFKWFQLSAILNLMAIWILGQALEFLICMLSLIIFTFSINFFTKTHCFD